METDKLKLLIETIGDQTKNIHPYYHLWYTTPVLHRTEGDHLFFKSDLHQTNKEIARRLYKPLIIFL